MARVPALNRPHYTPEERLEILAPRAAASWDAATRARVFQIAAATIASWARRLDEGGEAALPRPVNKLPEHHRAHSPRVALATTTEPDGVTEEESF